MSQKQPPKPKVKVFFEGRYRKLVRDLPQTRFYCPECKGRGRGCKRCDGFGKLTKDSVEELIARVVLPRYKSRKNKFHGAGREDVDVRMLGTGRPFVFEIINPKNLEVDLAETETLINERYKDRIEVENLRFCPKKRVAEVKETKCAKDYQARVQVDPGVTQEQLDALPGGKIDIIQKTPKRVAHRRADLERKRWIRILDAKVLGPDQIQLSIRSAHGTYIKEAISGEATEPSFPDLLGVQCQCLELDVLGILDSNEVAEATATE